MGHEDLTKCGPECILELQGLLMQESERANDNGARIAQLEQERDSWKREAIHHSGRSNEQAAEVARLQAALREARESLGYAGLDQGDGAEAFDILTAALRPALTTTPGEDEPE